MSAPQILHVEELVVAARTYTISVIRSDGGLAGEWYCRCGDSAVSAAAFATLGDALNDAIQGARRHHHARHASGANNVRSEKPL